MNHDDMDAKVATAASRLDQPEVGPAALAEHDERLLASSAEMTLEDLVRNQVKADAEMGKIIEMTQEGPVVHSM